MATLQTDAPITPLRRRMQQDMLGIAVIQEVQEPERLNGIEMQVRSESLARIGFRCPRKRA